MFVFFANVLTGFVSYGPQKYQMSTQTHTQAPSQRTLVCVFRMTAGSWE